VRKFVTFFVVGFWLFSFFFFFLYIYIHIYFSNEFDGGFFHLSWEGR
jgi:hypothetical protein